jgi:hypothetical protein
MLGQPSQDYPISTLLSKKKKKVLILQVNVFLPKNATDNITAL